MDLGVIEVAFVAYELGWEAGQLSLGINFELDQVDGLRRILLWISSVL